MSFICILRDKAFVAFHALALHFKVYHNLCVSGRFICHQGGCQREFSMLKQFRRHIYRDHKELFTCIPEPQCDEGKCVQQNLSEEFDSVYGFASGTSNSNTICDDSSLQSRVNLSAASFIAKLKSNSAIPSSFVSEIISSVEEFFIKCCIPLLKQKTV
jgi:hypothetical protein